MTGTITGVFKPHGSFTNAGREFYLGSLYPTYNYPIPSSISRQFIVYALISTFYDNVIYVTYYDANGTELTPTKYTVEYLPASASSARYFKNAVGFEC